MFKTEESLQVIEQGKTLGKVITGTDYHLITDIGTFYTLIS